jgi:hypothetical protein
MARVPQGNCPSKAPEPACRHDSAFEMTPQSHVIPAAAPVESEYMGATAVETTRGGRRSLVDKVRDWLWHAVPT